MIVAIDTHNWFHALWHARRGQQVTAEIARRIRALRASWDPESVVVALDGPTSWRRDLYPEYKSHRPAPPPDLVDELEKLPSVLCANQLANPLRVDGFEADDLLASLARSTADLGQRCVLCTSDKDLRQCLRAGSVTICREFHLEHHPEGDRVVAKFITEDLHVRDTGLPVSAWVDYLTLVGDSTDNVRGAEWIGPKTATKILQQVCTLEAAWSDLWRLRITDKQRVALFAFRERAELVRHLVTCRTDVPGVLDAL